MKLKLVWTFSAVSCSTKHTHFEKWFTSKATIPFFTSTGSFKSSVISAHSVDSLPAVRIKIFLWSDSTYGHSLSSLRARGIVILAGCSSFTSSEHEMWRIGPAKTDSSFTWSHGTHGTSCNCKKMSCSLDTVIIRPRLLRSTWSSELDGCRMEWSGFSPCWGWDTVLHSVSISPGVWTGTGEFNAGGNSG